MEEHQNHNLKCSRRKFGKIKSIYTKCKIKNMGRRNKIVQQKNLAFKKRLQTKATDNEVEYKRRRAITKRDIEKDIANPEKNLYHTYSLIYTK
jgi:hypothetical protein